MDELRKFAARIKAVFQTGRASQREMAEAFGVSQPTVFYWINDAMMPSAKNIPAIRKALPKFERRKAKGAGQ